MAGRGQSTRFMIGLAGFAALMLTLRGMAQQPEAPPPSSPPVQNAPVLPTTPGPSDPGQPTPPPVVEPGPAVPPGVSGGPAGGVTGFQPGFSSGPGSGFQPPPPAAVPPGAQRFAFRILPNTPPKNLLPTPPATKPAAPVLSDDLAKVPEAEFQARSARHASSDKLTEQTAHQLAKINHMNARKTDAFMTALLENRSDLAGLPFVMGDACRSVAERTKHFTQAVNSVRQSLAGNVAVVNLSGFVPQQSVTTLPGQPAQVGLLGTGQPFWVQYTAICEQEDAARSRPTPETIEHVRLARIAALTQMLATESADVRLGLVKYLTGVPHVEATRQLARLAIFSPEDDIRLAAIEALKVRREKDYTDVLVKGLRYPWPAVAKRSADTIQRLGRTDLVPELVAVLDETDPRLPVAREVDGKKVSVVREMVRINHHRNCMMCHAPGSPENAPENAITAEVPIPGQPLPLPSQGYRQSSPDLMIRVDVTYLRQDFSTLLPVADANPWPEMQRFDFFVRERKLTAEEATAFRTHLTPREPGVLSPYHRAALAALREMTGKDTAPTAEAWRKLLDLPARTATPAKSPEPERPRG